MSLAAAMPDFPEPPEPPSDEPAPRLLDASPDETTIITRRAVKGDREALESLWEKFHDWLHALAVKRLSRSTATLCDPDDLISEVWVTVLPRLGRLRPNEGGRMTPVFLRYVSSVLLYKYSNLLRRHMSAREGEGTDSDSSSAGQPQGPASPSAPLETQERRNAVFEAIGELGEMDQMAVYLRGIQQVDVKETAFLMRISESAVTSRYFRALRKLREILSKQHHGVLDDLLAEEEEAQPPAGPESGGAS